MEIVVAVLVGSVVLGAICGLVVWKLITRPLLDEWDRMKEK